MIERPKERGESQPGAGNEGGLNLALRAVRVLKSPELFGDQREVVIEHEGEHYRLRATRKGKLILTK